MGLNLRSCAIDRHHTGDECPERRAALGVAPDVLAETCSMVRLRCGEPRWLLGPTSRAGPACCTCCPCGVPRFGRSRTAAGRLPHSSSPNAHARGSRVPPRCQSVAGDSRDVQGQRWWGGAVTRPCPAIVTDGAKLATRAYARRGRPDDPDQSARPARLVHCAPAWLTARSGTPFGIRALRADQPPPTDQILCLPRSTMASAITRHTAAATTMPHGLRRAESARQILCSAPTRSRATRRARMLRP